MANNPVGASEGAGICLHNAEGTTVQGNFIETDRGATLNLGNALHGILVETPFTDNSVLASSNAGEANIIAFNGGAGVFVEHDDRGNQIAGNSIFANGGLGIDLEPAGVTPNDSGDGDGGPTG